MRHSSHRWIATVGALAVALCAGCPGPSTPEDPGTAVSPPGPSAPDAATPRPEAPVAEPPEEPPAPTMPEVLLTEAEQAKCLVKVGDPLPDAELPDLAGDAHSLASLLGEKASIVVFWSRGSSDFSALAARATLEDLQKDLFEPYSAKGVQVIGINVRDAAETVKALVDESGAAFPILLDADGSLFAKVATEKLPRPYFVDAEGQIRYFDLEFSRTTRDKLLQAIEFVLSGENQDG